MSHRAPSAASVRFVVLVGIATAVLAVLPAAAAPHVPAPSGDTVVIHGLESADGRAPSGWDTSVPTAAPITFSLLGARLPAGAAAEVRTSRDGRVWTRWTGLEPLDIGPDPATAEHTGTAGGMSEPVWIGEARHVQIRVAGGHPGDVELHLVDDGAGPTVRPGTRTASTTSTGAGDARPEVVSRAGWDADESLRNGDPRYADRVRYGVVHHTATGNDYSRAEAPGVVRSIYRYHTTSLGWDDIGYHILVDRYGTVYEGRGGGLDEAVVGAHAAGFNRESFSISFVGNFQDAPPPQVAMDAAAAMLGWKLAVHDITPDGTVTVTSGGSSLHPAGTEVTLATIAAHRDVGRTACPGDALYPLLGEVREAAAAAMPELHDPPGEGSADEESPDGDGPEEPEPVPFTDITDTVHRPSIESVYRRHVTTGCEADRYCPELAVTRGQVATFLARSFALPDGPATTFPDVPADSTHAAGIAAIAAAGITEGHADGTFRPRQPLTRQHMAVLLHRALELEPVWGEIFVDVPFEPAWPRARINALAETGITRGCGGGRFCPQAEVTRAQMASFLDRALETAGSTGPTS